jgi:acyl carrier protein
MEHQTSDIEHRVRQTLARVFNFPMGESSHQLRMGSLPGWDSLGHMQLLLGLEDEFGFRFPSYEIANLISADAIVQVVSKHQPADRP